MTTDPNNPSTPPPSTPPPSTPPPSTPPPVDAGGSFGATPGTPPGYTAPTSEGASYPPPAPPAQPPSHGTPPPVASPASSVSFDRTKVGMYDMGLAAAAVLFLIALILPWASIDFGAGFGSVTIGGFDIGRLTFALILLIAVAAFAVLPAFGVKLALPVSRGWILIGVTALVAIITFTAFIDILTTSEVGTGIGAWLGMLVALGAVALAVLTLMADQAGSRTAA